MNKPYIFLRTENVKNAAKQVISKQYVEKVSKKQVKLVWKPSCSNSIRTIRKNVKKSLVIGCIKKSVVTNGSLQVLHSLRERGDGRSMGL